MIDHSILFHRLSVWFGLQGTALKWLKSYLSSRDFSVKCTDSFSNPRPLAFRVPQGSVLGPLLYIFYSTPLSHLISLLSLNHHLYADDTQLFFSFFPTSFSESVAHLQSALSKISDWMSANLLTLNPNKTEYLLIGLPTQLAKISNPALPVSPDTVITSSTSARNLGFLLIDNHLSLNQHISSLSKSCFIHIRDLRRIRPFLSLFHSKLPRL